MTALSPLISGLGLSARPVLRHFLLLSMLLLVGMRGAGLSAQEDPYLAWTQGRPEESLPQLWQRAQQAGWRAWYDAGLCAAAAEQPIPAKQALLQAHRAAPWRSEARSALAILGLEELPRQWQDRLGPLAMSADGPIGLLLSLLLGISLGWVLIGLPYRTWAALVLALSALLLLPSLTARWLDGHTDWALSQQDLTLVNVAGQSLHSLPAGSLVIVEEAQGHAARARVRLLDGQRGFLPSDALLIIGAE